MCWEQFISSLRVKAVSTSDGKIDTCRPPMPLALSESEAVDWRHRDFHCVEQCNAYGTSAADIDCAWCSGQFFVLSCVQ